MLEVMILAPGRRGFGTKIITSSISQGGGDAQFEWGSDGLKFRLKLACGRKSVAVRGLSHRPPASADPNAKRVLVVEDEAMIGMLTATMVEELGYAPLGPMTNLADANAVIARDNFDVAVIDLNLGGQPAYPLAEALSLKGVPFIFVTGYAPDTIDRRFAHVPLIQKPIPREELATAIARAMRPAALAGE
jgi:CheY-like chemotaxis protein